MKLNELFNGDASFDNGDFVKTEDGHLGQIMSDKDEKGCYKIKLKKGGRIIFAHHADLKLASKEDLKEAVLI